MTAFNVESIVHVSLIVADIETALHFYQDILGLDLESRRPDLGYPGAWLQIGNLQIHLLQLPNPDPVSNRPEHGGRDRHVAFHVKPFAAFIEKLESHKIPYTSSKSGRAALFIRDPDGNALEFISSEE